MSCFVCDLMSFLASFGRGGPTLTTIFLVDEVRDDPNTTKSEPLSVSQRNIHWRADDSPTLNSGLVAL